MSQNTPTVDIPQMSHSAATRHILTTVLFSFLCYLSIGLPLAVLPGFVHVDLAFGSILAGLAISMQYVATVISRPWAGRMADSAGPKRTVTLGLYVMGAGGLLTAVAAWLGQTPWLSLVVLMIARLGIGFAESWVATGSITWGIGQVGAVSTGRVISWNGIATFGGLAIGAPLGVIINDAGGLGAIGLTTLAFAVGGALLARRKPATPVLGGKELAFRSVLSRVAPYGMSLALGAVGFGALASFVALYYANRGWLNPAYALTAFGAFFVITRLVLANAINRFGGFRVSIFSLATECVGLMLLWLADSPAAALTGAALTGVGYALVFPGLAVEAVKLVPPNHRGSALGAYSLFLDLAMGITGPIAGLIVTGFGYPEIFLFAMLCAVAATGIAIALYLRSERTLRAENAAG